MEKQQTPRNPQEAIAQANRFQRAQQIIEAGYTFSQDVELETVYVCKPNELHAAYTIGEQLTGRDGCSCPDFQKTGIPCKHMMAWEIIQKQEADELEGLEAQCARYDAEEGWADLKTSQLQRMRNLLHAELTDAENRAMQLHHEPFCNTSAVRSWLNKADRCKKALRQFDETLTKVQIGLLTL